MSLLDDIVNSDATPEPVIIVQVSGGDTVFGAVIVEQPTENPILVELLQEAPAISGYSGFSGVGVPGVQGLSGYSGLSGSGKSGYSGYSGLGLSGYSGYSGMDGTFAGSGFSGYSGFSAASPGPSGYSGYSASGVSGYSGFSGSGVSGFSGSDGLTQRAVTLVVDGSGSVLTTGIKNPIKIPFGGTLQGWLLIGSPSGSVTVDILRSADGAGLPVTSIVGAGTEPSLSGAVENSSTNFTNWTSTILTAKDNLAIDLSGITTTTYCELTLYFQ